MQILWLAFAACRRESQTDRRLEGRRAPVDGEQWKRQRIIIPVVW